MDEVMRAYLEGYHSVINFRRLFMPAPDERIAPDFHNQWNDMLLHGKKHVAIEAFRESGKALALETPIMTTNGWKTIGDIQPNDYVYGDDGKPVKVIAISPIFYDHNCYKVKFSDKTEVIADAGHKWTVYNKHKRKECVLTTEEMSTTYTLGKPKGNYQEYAYRIKLIDGVCRKPASVQNQTWATIERGWRRVGAVDAVATLEKAVAEVPDAATRVQPLIDSLKRVPVNPLPQPQP
jgi:hypothetical protein